jgi:predicted O-methyltransferase YrrM
MNPDEVLRSIENEAPKRGWPIIGPIRGVILDGVVSEHHPSSILEVGTLVGYSAIRMGRHLRPGQKIICVEASEDMATVARGNIEKAGLSDRISVVVGDANKVLPKLQGSFDMVYLDAVKDEYLGYLKSVERLLHKGSVIAADNVKSHPVEVADYLDYVRNSGKFRSEYRESPNNYRYSRGRFEADAVEVSVML